MVIHFIISNLPHGDEMLDNIITVTEIQLEHDVLNHVDSLTLESLCILKVSEGGPAVVAARNRLNRYVVESESIETPNKSKKKITENSFWVNIYPNPSKGELTINTNSDNILVIEIYDITGKVVYHKKGVENNTILNLNSLTNGLYSVKLQDNSKNIKLFKWVVSK